ncbi:MAG: SDR family NAD(P)-dependent oxidoreductase [Holophagales bacterium]|jgi:NADP-dependent 3-hydroxy acid dehydrogenase YdfG|nr:SDR family NAD(P)-dependent oxidoreductase [Holophagales bacterium]
MRPEPPIVLITGASSGFGESTARLLAAEGCHLALGARRKDRLKNIALELSEKFGINVFDGEVDTRDTASVRNFVDSAVAHLGAIHVVIANAGLASGLHKIWEIPDEDMEAMLRTNVEGVVKTIRAALPHIRSAGWGHIFFVGSTAGHQTYEGGGVYSASKHGVKALAHALRLELCGEPIRVTSIDPGMAKTEFALVRYKDQARAESLYEGMDTLTGADIAECVRWCLELPDYVNIDEMIVKCRDQASHTMSKVHRH